MSDSITDRFNEFQRRLLEATEHYIREFNLQPNTVLLGIAEVNIISKYTVAQQVHNSCVGAVDEDTAELLLEADLLNMTRMANMSCLPVRLPTCILPVFVEREGPHTLNPDLM